jgi:hypothetical protein
LTQARMPDIYQGAWISEILTFRDIPRRHNLLLSDVASSPENFQLNGTHLIGRDSSNICRC